MGGWGLPSAPGMKIRSPGERSPRPATRAPSWYCAPIWALSRTLTDELIRLVVWRVG